eukprot:6710382-Pyramimonas_sp.AAC.1
MATFVLWTAQRSPRGARGTASARIHAILKFAWRETQPYEVVDTAIVNIVFGGAPNGTTNCVKGALTSGGAAMRTLPLAPSVELHMSI